MDRGCAAALPSGVEMSGRDELEVGVEFVEERRVALQGGGVSVEGDLAGVGEPSG